MSATQFTRFVTTAVSVLATSAIALTSQATITRATPLAQPIPDHYTPEHLSQQPQGNLVRIQPATEATSNTQFSSVDKDFQFTETQIESLQNPEKTVIIIQDSFSNPTVNVNIEDAIPDISHGGMISSIIRSDPHINDDIRNGTIDIINLETTSDENIVLRALSQIPKDYKSNLILSLSIGTTGSGSEWGPVVERIKDLGASGDLHVFVAHGNTGVLGGSNALASMLSGIPNVTTVASSYDILGRPGNRPLSATSSIIGSLNEQNTFASTLVIDRNGDINRDGIPDLGTNFTADISEPSEAFGSQDASKLIGLSADKVFASKDQSDALLQNRTPQPAVLYSLTDLKSAGLIDDIILRELTNHLPNPDYDKIFVDPEAASNYGISFGDWGGVVFFERSDENIVQLYNGKNGVNFSIVHASTSFATPAYIVDFLTKTTER
jgi:hypothetical protein